MKFTCAHDRLQFRNRRSNIVIRIFAIHLLFLIAIAPFSRAGTPTTVYVDPAGNDNGGNCGSTKAKACASLAQAQLLVRNNPGSTVLVDGGYYYLPSSPTNPGTLSFGTADSGASGAVTTWEANPGTGTPVISGGIRLNSSIATASHNGSLYQFQFKSTANIQPFEYLFYTPPGATEPQRRLRARVQSSSASAVGFYMNGATCEADNWPSAAGSVPTLTPAYCNLGTFLRLINTVTPGSTGCTSLTNSNDTSETKCMDRFDYDPTDTAIASLVNGISGYATNLNGTYNSSGTGVGFGGPNGSPAGPCVPTSGSQFPEGDIEVTLFDAWTVDVLRIGCIDTTHNVIYFTSAAKMPATGTSTNIYNDLGPTVNHRYIIENSRTAFFTAWENGQTGLWYLDKSTTPWTLDYIANSGENPFSDPITIPQLGTSFGAFGTTDPVGGSLISATNLSYVTFSGLTFEVDNNTPVATNYSTGVGGGFNSDDNGESNVPQVIDCESCQFVTFNGITVRHTSGTGIRVATAPSTITCTSTSPCVTIENSKFYDIGDDGIHIGHVPVGTDTSATAVQNILVTNNYVQGFSRVFPDGEGIAQGNGFNTTYSYNDIADGYHAGLSVCENACPPIAVNGNNVVSSFNHIRDINQGITSDGGTLYYHLGGGGGSATGGLISNNFVHDNTDSSIIDNPLYGSYPTHGSGYGGHGIYLDNQTADVNVEYNVVYNVSGSTAWMTGGPAQVTNWKPNTFTGNIFAYGRLNMFAEQQPWPNVSSCPSTLSPLVKLASNIFYFDLNETSNSSNSLGFYVQGGCAYSCSAGASANYNNFQDYTDNLYWRTDGNFASDPDQFHVYNSTFSPPSSCQGPASTTAITNQWKFIPFHNSTNSNDSWQAGTYSTLPLNVTEDAQGLISQPTFYSSIGSCTSKAGAYCLAGNPTGMTGFNYTDTNSTVTSAGSTLTAPATVPATFPTYIYSVTGSF
jgi:hypothetical protein